MKNQAKKSLYIFLCALLGALLFMVLHQLIAFVYFILLSFGFNTLSFGMSGLQILALDYFTLILVLLAGFWYGIWLGLYWYNLVYEEKSHQGMLKALNQRLRQISVKKNVSSQITNVAQHVESEMWQLEDLAQELPQERVVTVPVKRRVTKPRTRSVKKIDKLIE